MKHVVLLGDSIFDNAACTAGRPDVVTHLRRLLARSASRATLCAVDGNTASALERQLGHVPADASHLVVARARRWAAMRRKTRCWRRGTRGRCSA